MPDEAWDSWREMLVTGTISRWDELRLGNRSTVADDRVRAWLFETLPGQARASSDEHAFAMLELAIELDKRGRTADAFSVLRWVGERYVNDPEAEVAARALMAVTDDCMSLGRRDEEHHDGATQALRAVIRAAEAPRDIRVERALCRALVHLGYLIAWWSPNGHHQASQLAELWEEIIRRWRTSADPELRGRVAQALGSRAFLWLQRDREADARREFAEVIRLFGQDPPGQSADIDHYVCVARHAPAILSRTAIDGPEFDLRYLRAQQHWDRQRQLGDDHMSQLVRLASEKHKSSVGKLRSWLCDGVPFVLLLRNFELSERSGATSLWNERIAKDHTGRSPDYVRTIRFRESDQVLKELDSGVPLVAVASTTAGELEIRSDMGQFVPGVELYLPAATWFDTVSTLVALAGQIIVRAAELTDGLKRELAAVTAQGRADDTLILLEEPISDPAVDSIMVPRAMHDRLIKDNPALAGFAHVVEAAQLEGRQVADCPALMRLIGRLDDARDTPVEERIAAAIARLTRE